MTQRQEGFALHNKKSGYILLELIIALCIFFVFINSYLLSHVYLSRLEHQLSQARQDIYEVRNLYIYAMSAPLDVIRNDARYIVINGNNGLVSIRPKEYEIFSDNPLLRLNETDSAIN